MAINGFEGDFELSLGSVVGVRAFKIDWLGRLVGVSQDDKVFTPEVNTAECYRCQLKRLADCECGFYGYFSGQDNQYMRGNPVGAIIEGTGKTVIGTKGFRTEKAKLLALFPLGGKKNRARGPVRITRNLYPTAEWFVGTRARQTEAAWGIGSTIAVVVLLIVGLALVIAASATEYGIAALVLCAWLVGFFRRMVYMDTNSGRAILNRISRTSQKPVEEPDPFERLRELYPDVPVYKSLKEALRKHPLSTAEKHIPDPVLPSPATEDNFWKLSTTPRRNTYVR